MGNEIKNDNVSTLFVQLVLSFQAAAWQQLGKIANPLTNKVERSLEMAKNSIDILGMLEEKTKGNLTEDEAKLLQHMLTELRMNYIDESKKPKAEEKDTPEQSDKQSEDEDKKE